MDSILIALIGSLSALGGAIVGGFCSCYSISKQMKSEAKRVQHKEKQEAYSAFLAAYHRFLLTSQKGKIQDPEDITDMEMDESIRFSMAYSAAALIAPASIRKELKELFALASTHAQGNPAPGLVAKYSDIEDLLFNDLQDG